MRAAVYQLIYMRRVVYIGCTYYPEKRLLTHRRTRSQGDAIKLGKVIWFDDRETAEMAERVAIRRRKPVWNIDHTPTASRVRSEAKRRADAARMAANIEAMIANT